MDDGRALTNIVTRLLGVYEPVASDREYCEAQIAAVRQEGWNAALGAAVQDLLANANEAYEECQRWGLKHDTEARSQAHAYLERGTAFEDSIAIIRALMKQEEPDDDH